VMPTAMEGSIWVMRFIYSTTCSREDRHRGVRKASFSPKKTAESPAGRFGLSVGTWIDCGKLTRSAACKDGAGWRNSLDLASPPSGIHCVYRDHYPWVSGSGIAGVIES
jgi:hypothetical protein